jgi:hypothetical protein
LIVELIAENIVIVQQINSFTNVSPTLIVEIENAIVICNNYASTLPESALPLQSGQASIAGTISAINQTSSTSMDRSIDGGSSTNMINTPPQAQYHTQTQQLHAFIQQQQMQQQSFGHSQSHLSGSSMHLTLGQNKDRSGSIISMNHVASMYFPNPITLSYTFIQPVSNLPVCHQITKLTANLLNSAMNPTPQQQQLMMGGSRSSRNKNESLLIGKKSGNGRKSMMKDSSMNIGGGGGGGNTALLVSVSEGKRGSFYLGDANASDTSRRNSIIVGSGGGDFWEGGGDGGNGGVPSYLSISPNGSRGGSRRGSVFGGLVAIQTTPSRRGSIIVPGTSSNANRRSSIVPLPDIVQPT